NRIGLKGRGVERCSTWSIPAIKQRFASGECAEGNRVVHEGFVEDDDIRRNLLKYSAGAAAERCQTRAVDTRDDQRVMTPHEQADGFRMGVKKLIGSRYQHE